MNRTVLVFAAMVMAAGLLVLAGEAGPAVAAFPGDNGKIVFWSDRSAGPGFYTITPGGAATKIPGASGGDNHAAWSPDGSRIVFQSTSTTSKEISVMNADGGGRRQLTSTTAVAEQEPTWSPDGTRIVFAASTSGSDATTDLEIWTMNADGSGLTQLTNTVQGVRDTQPAWSPDGGRISFLSEGRTGDTNSNIYVMDTDPATDDATNLTPNTSAPVYQFNDEDPTWSPDGQQIAYSTAPDIWKINADGSGKTNLTDGEGGIHPAWSPDGTRITYVDTAPGSTDRNIYVMNADGSGSAPIDSTLRKDEKPDWQPIPACTNANSTSGNDTINGTPGDDVLCGMVGNDQINGRDGNDLILGGGGNDTLVGAAGKDTLDGGSGTDTASFAGSTTPIQASLVSGFARRTGTQPLEGVTLLGIENLTGSSSGDELSGDGGANKLVGGKGADELLGLGGKDRLDSRDNVNRNDTVNGGSGTDRCLTDRREASIKGCE